MQLNSPRAEQGGDKPAAVRGAAGGREAHLPKEPKITVQVVSEFAARAQARLGKESLSVEEWLALAREAEERGRYYHAAVYYHIASLAAAPDSRAETYRVLAEEMQDRMIFGPFSTDDL